MSSPDITAREREAVDEVLQTPFLSMGPKLQAFEEAIAARAGAGHGIGVSSGTSGLHMCVIAAGCGPGDLVITTPFSFVASANCILYEGSVPVFVDVDEDTGNIDPVLVREIAEALIEGDRSHLPPLLRDDESEYRVRALLPVHAFGQPADMDPLLELSAEHSLSVVEDACEAIGAEYRGRPAGSLGDAAVFAFYPNKQMTTGEGGMVVTSNDEWASTMRSLRNQGRDVFDSWLNHSRLGFNYRLDELSAALGLVQASRLDEILAKRARVASWYTERLVAVDGVDVPRVAEPTTKMSWFVYVIRLTSATARARVMAGLEDEGVPSRPYFSPVHLQPFYVERFGYRAGDFPITERLGATSLALPFSSVMTEAQVNYVCDLLVKVIRS